MAKTALQLLSDRNNDGRPPLELALDNYEIWLNASQALASGKDYEISNGQGSKRKLSRNDASEVKMMLEYWEFEVDRLQDNQLLTPKINPIYTVGNPNA